MPSEVWAPSVPRLTRLPLLVESVVASCVDVVGYPLNQSAVDVTVPFLYASHVKIVGCKGA